MQNADLNTMHNVRVAKGLRSFYCVKFGTLVLYRCIPGSALIDRHHESRGLLSQSKGGLSLMSQSPTQQEVPVTEGADQHQSLDVLDQLMKPEVQESLTVLVENLPKLAEMVTVMTKAYDFAQSIATDKVLISDTMSAMGEFAKPVVNTAKGVASAAIEAGDRAQVDQSTVGLFGMLKMLKDPNVQKSLRFAQAFLSVLNERQQQR